MGGFGDSWLAPWSRTSPCPRAVEKQHRYLRRAPEPTEELRRSGAMCRRRPVTLHRSLWARPLAPFLVAGGGDQSRVDHLPGRKEVQNHAGLFKRRGCARTRGGRGRPCKSCGGARRGAQDVAADAVGLRVGPAAKARRSSPLGYRPPAPAAVQVAAGLTWELALQPGAGQLSRRLRYFIKLAFVAMT
jgi:hypothetical protein